MNTKIAQSTQRRKNYHLPYLLDSPKGWGLKKKGKLLISHRSTVVPLLPSEPGGVEQELVV